MAEVPTSNISTLAFPDFVDTVERVHELGDSLINDLALVKSLYKIENIL